MLYILIVHCGRPAAAMLVVMATLMAQQADPGSRAQSWAERIIVDEPVVLAALAAGNEGSTLILRETLLAKRETAVLRGTRACGALGPPARPLIGILSSHLGSPFPSIRAASAEALARVCPEDRDVAAQLWKYATDSHEAEVVRRSCAYACAVIDPEFATKTIDQFTRDGDSRRFEEFATCGAMYVAPALIVRLQIDKSPQTVVRETLMHSGWQSTQRLFNAGYADMAIASADWSLQKRVVLGDLFRFELGGAVPDVELPTEVFVEGAMRSGSYSVIHATWASGTIRVVELMRSLEDKSSGRQVLLESRSGGDGIVRSVVGFLGALDKMHLSSKEPSSKTVRTAVDGGVSISVQSRDVLSSIQVRGGLLIKSTGGERSWFIDELASTSNCERRFRIEGALVVMRDILRASRLASVASAKSDMEAMYDYQSSMTRMDPSWSGSLADRMINALARDNK